MLKKIILLIVSNKISQIDIKFFIFSFVLTILNLIIFHILSGVILNIYIFTFIYYLIAICLKFLSYKLFVFKEKFKYKLVNKLLKYLLLYLVSYFINVEYLKLVTIYFDQPLVIFQLIFVILNGLLSFFVIKKLIFKY